MQGGAGSIPGQGTKILHAIHHALPKKHSFSSSWQMLLFKLSPNLSSLKLQWLSESSFTTVDLKAVSRRPYCLACLPLERGHYNQHGPFQNAFFQSGTYAVLELEWECCSGKLVFSKGLGSPRSPQETGRLLAPGGNAGCSIWDPTPWLNFVSRPLPFFAIWVEHGVGFCLLNFIPFEHLSMFLPLPLPE